MSLRSVMAKSLWLAKQPRATPPRRAALRSGFRQSARGGPDPDLQPAIAGGRIEFLVIALEVRRVGGFHARSRQPVIPDRVHGAANGRDVRSVSKHDIALFGDPHAPGIRAAVRRSRCFDAGNVVEIAGIVAVAADAIGHLADPAGDVVDDLVEALPQVGNAGALFSWVQRSPIPATSRALPVSKRGALRLSSGVEFMMIGS